MHIEKHGKCNETERIAATHARYGKRDFTLFTTLKLSR